MTDDAEGYARQLRTYNAEDDTAIADVAEVWLESHEDLARPIAVVIIERLRGDSRTFPLTEALALVDENLSDAEFAVRARAGMAAHRLVPRQVIDDALRRLENALDAYATLTELGAAVWPVIATSDDPAAVALRNRLSMGEFDR